MLMILLFLFIGGYLMFSAKYFNNSFVPPGYTGGFSISNIS